MSFENEIRRTNHRKKKPNTFLIAGYAAVLVLCVVVMFALGAFGKDDKPSSSAVASSEQSSFISMTETSSSESTTSSKVSTTSSKSPTPSTTSSAVTSAYVPNGDWKLIIANKQHPMPESYKINLSYVSGNYRLDSRIADAYKSMISAAKQDGISLKIISGFRTFSGQKTLFNNKVNYYINRGYSRQKATELAAEYVAPPGTSDHLTGLAVDLISPDWYSYNSNLNSDFENTKQFEWLYNNCAEYGFILRYPKGKTSITGYAYEPWHYRYVGVDAAKDIMSRKICLEEYVAQMQ
ncbi:MAG: D-alanyl-D-alanine carboxypeptidase family protein [Ruminococcaceae bacterium]|nr:D-alanyl-D-alanine carboxypeptidase family protein [Oscillospiraceae bacterium]